MEDDKHTNNPEETRFSLAEKLNEGTDLPVVENTGAAEPTPENPDVAEAKEEALKQIQAQIEEYNFLLDVLKERLSHNANDVKAYFESMGKVLREAKLLVHSVMIGSAPPAALGEMMAQFDRLGQQRTDSLDGMDNAINHFTEYSGGVKNTLAKLAVDVQDELAHDSGWSDVATEANYRSAQVSERLESLVSNLQRDAQSLHAEDEHLRANIALIRAKAGELVHASPREIHTENYNAHMLIQIFDEMGHDLDTDYRSATGLTQTDEAKIG